MNWTDSRAIAIALEEAYPERDNRYVRFTDLHDWVLSLEGFEGKPGGCNERILEAIQMAWIDERD